MTSLNPIHFFNDIQSLVKHSVRAFITAGHIFVGSTQAAPPANDNFANAIELEADNGNQTGTNTIDATFEVGEPRMETAGGVLHTNTVWFKWTATANGNFTINTVGSKNSFDFEWDSVLGIYLLSPPNTFTPLGSTPLDRLSSEKMTISVRTGKTYLIQLAGYYNSVATNINLDWNFVETFEPKIETFGPDAIISTVSSNVGSINWTVPIGSNFSTLAPTFTLSPGATCNRISGAIPSPNFSTGPVIYTVTSGGPNATITNYTVTATLGNSLLWNVATGGLWNTVALNWLKQPFSLSSIYRNGDAVTFNNNAGGTITIPSPVAPGAITVSAASGTYNFTGATLGGGGSLTKNNAGNLTLNGINTFSGNTVVNGGTLAVNGPDAISGSTDFSVASGASLNFNTPPPVLNVKQLWARTPAILTGAGTVNVALSGNQDVGLNIDMGAFTGTVNISGGSASIVFVYSPNFLSPQTGTLNLGNNTTLYLGWLGGTFTSNIKLSSGADNGEGLGVLRADYATLLGTLTLASNSTIGCNNDPNSTESFTINSTISDGGNGFGITAVGSGKVILTGPANTYTGTTAVKLGSTLQVNAPGSLGSGPLSINGKLNPNYVGTKTVSSLKLGGVTQIAPGTYGSTASLATYPNNSYFTPGSLGTVTIGNKFATWMSDYTFPVGANVTESGDADGDGMSNFHEYAFGLDPSLSSSSNPITQQLDTVTDEFKYTRRANLATTDIVYTILTSTDLVTWTAGGTNQTSITSLGSVETVAVNVTAPALLGKLFVKVQATPMQ